MSSESLDVHQCTVAGIVAAQSVAGSAAVGRTAAADGRLVADAVVPAAAVLDGAVAVGPDVARPSVFAAGCEPLVSVAVVAL